MYFICNDKKLMIVIFDVCNENYECDWVVIFFY